MIVAFNNAAQPRSFALPLEKAGLGRVKHLTDRLGKLGRIDRKQGTVDFSLPPRTAVVLTP